MKKRTNLLLIIFFFCGGSLSAQQHLPFYYYKGNRIMLPVNTQHFLVYADANKISKELFEKEYRVTEWIEDAPTIPAISNHNSQFTHHNKIVISPTENHNP